MAVDYLLKIEGVEGESVVDNHTNEIDIISWSWNITQSGTAHIGGGAGAGRASVGDLEVEKWVDKSSPLIYKACLGGKVFPKVTLIGRKAGDKALEYLFFDMDKVLVSSVSAGGTDGDERPKEKVKFNFKGIAPKYVPQKDDGSGDAEVSFSWDVAKGVEV